MILGRKTFVLYSFLFGVNIRTDQSTYLLSFTDTNERFQRHHGGTDEGIPKLVQLFWQGLQLLSLYMDLHKYSASKHIPEKKTHQILQIVIFFYEQLIMAAKWNFSFFLSFAIGRFCAPWVITISVFVFFLQRSVRSSLPEFLRGEFWKMVSWYSWCGGCEMHFYASSLIVFGCLVFISLLIRKKLVSIAFCLVKNIVPVIRVHHLLFRALKS